MKLLKTINGVLKVFLSPLTRNRKGIARKGSSVFCRAFLLIALFLMIDTQKHLIRLQKLGLTPEKASVVFEKIMLPLANHVVNEFDKQNLKVKKGGLANVVR